MRALTLPFPDHRVIAVLRLPSAALATLLLTLSAGLFSLVPGPSLSWQHVSAENIPKFAPSDRLLLKLDGIDGEVTDADHKNELALKSFTWTQTHPDDSSSAVSLKPFHFVMHTDRSMPLIVRKEALHEAIAKAVLTVRSSIGQDYMKWTLTNAHVTAFQITEAVGQVKAEVSFDLTFDRVDIEYRAQLYNGGLGTAVKGGWAQ